MREGVEELLLKKHIQKIRLYENNSKVGLFVAVKRKVRLFLTIFHNIKTKNTLMVDLASNKLVHICNR